MEGDPYEIAETVSSTELKYISGQDITRLTREEQTAFRLQITSSHEKISSPRHLPVSRISLACAALERR